MSTGLIDQAMSFMADKINTPIVHDSVTLDYATLSAANGWTAPENGFVIFGIAPSNTSAAFASLRNITDDYPIANVSSVNGANQSTTGIVLKGKTYRVVSATANVATGTRTAAQYFKLLGGGTS